MRKSSPVSFAKVRKADISLKIFEFPQNVAEIYNTFNDVLFIKEIIYEAKYLEKYVL